jgi:DnaJ domain
LGVLGAAGLIADGAVIGGTQIVRGVIAKPEAMMAPRQGKWWNDAASSRVYSDLSKNKIPDNDDDILGTSESDLDCKQEFTTNNEKGQVVDMFYYEALEVDATADDHKVKRQSYLMARKYHPDKNGGDNEAADKFKTISEAHQVLSDPELRAKYDQEGRDGHSQTRPRPTTDKRLMRRCCWPFCLVAINFSYLLGDWQLLRVPCWEILPI